MGARNQIAGLYVRDLPRFCRIYSSFDVMLVSAGFDWRRRVQYDVAV